MKFQLFALPYKPESVPAAIHRINSGEFANATQAWHAMSPVRVPHNHTAYLFNEAGKLCPPLKLVHRIPSMTQ